jgi:ribosome modulation factor
METDKGAAESFGVTGPDPWMAGYIAHGKGDRHSAPVWFLPGDQEAWLQGWRDAEQAYREAASGN